MNATAEFQFSAAKVAVEMSCGVMLKSGRLLVEGSHRDSWGGKGRGKEGRRDCATPMGVEGVRGNFFILNPGTRIFATTQA